MTLQDYEELTGTVVAADQVELVEAQIRRAKRILETLLGFTLDPDKAKENLYNEEGKTTAECACPDTNLQLDPPDDVAYAYRLYDYNRKDKYFHVDPFAALAKVKLVKDGVTLKTYDAEDIRVQYGRDGWSKFIENCFTNLACGCSCSNCMQLAVDADWLWDCQDPSADPSVGALGCIPEDLLYLWVDMIGYYVNCKKDVRSETVGSHSYTKYDRRIPEQEDVNVAIIKRYAGPYGAVTKMPVP